MSKTTIALETAVATVIENRPAVERPSARQRANVDRAFAHILKLLAPRIRHFIRQYGLTAHWEDAEQCCAIAVHRAIQAYAPEKAQFTTFVNWQIRGELQGLRFRLMTDQRPSARKVDATTVSLNALVQGPDGEDMSPEALIEDEYALERTEAGASDYLANGAVTALVDVYIAHLRKVGIAQLQRQPQPKRGPGPRREAGSTAARLGVDPDELEKLEAKLQRDRDIVERRIFQTVTLDDIATETGVTKERVRQITKRAAKVIADLVGADPRFAVMAETQQAAAPTVREPARQHVEPHDRLARVAAIYPVEADEASPANDAGAVFAAVPARLRRVANR